jgi:hypothetical protein
LGNWFLVGIFLMARQRYYFSDRLARKQRNTKIFLATFVVLAVSAGTAWSHESHSSNELGGQAAPASLSLPISVTDSCLPLLKSIRHIAPDNVTDVTQRPAGKKAAALGLALGYRFALGPVQTQQRLQYSTKAKALVDFRQPEGNVNGRNAHATAVYRDCRKREALSTLVNPPSEL